jgi:hypothetical protein
MCFSPRELSHGPAILGAGAPFLPPHARLCPPLKLQFTRARLPAHSQCLPEQQPRLHRRLGGRCHTPTRRNVAHHHPPIPSIRHACHRRRACCARSALEAERKVEEHRVDAGSAPRVGPGRLECHASPAARPQGPRILDAHSPQETGEGHRRGQCLAVLAGRRGDCQRRLLPALPLLPGRRLHQGRSPGAQCRFLFRHRRPHVAHAHQGPHASGRRCAFGAVFRCRLLFMSRGWVGGGCIRC